MAEGTYEYECMRAELLGIEKPNYDVFMQQKKDNEQIQALEEDVDIENLKEVDLETEGMQRVSGKLDELNNILKKTQSKISQMKVTCGSVAGRLKNRLGSFNSQSSVETVENTERSVEENDIKVSVTETGVEKPKSSENGTPARKSDLAKALDKDLSGLDAMIEKAENAQLSMEYQTKEMKKFIK